MNTNTFNAQEEVAMEIERTKNYIKFQIHQAETMLDKFGTDSPKICYAHLIEWKKNLVSELYELNKANRKH